MKNSAVYRFIKRTQHQRKLTYPQPAAAYIHLERHLLQVQIILSFSPSIIRSIDKMFSPFSPS